MASVQHIFDNPGRMDSLQHEDQGEIYGIDAFNDHSTFTFSFLGSVVLQTVNDAIECMYACILRARVQPTLARTLRPFIAGRLR